MKPLPTIRCAGHLRYAPLLCGCRLEERREPCGRVVQQGEPGGETRVAGICPLCKAQSELERRKWGRQMYRHAHHKSHLERLADPFAAVRPDAE